MATTDAEIAELQKRVAKFRGGNDQKLFSKALEQNLKGKATTNKIEQNPQNKSPVPKDTNTDKVVNSAETAPGKVDPDKVVNKSKAEAASKESKGILNTIKNAFKGKKGKYAAIGALAVAAIGTGVALLSGKGDKNVEQVGTAVPEKPEQQKQPVQKNPNTVAKEDSVATEKIAAPVTSKSGEEQAAPVEKETEEYVVQKGDNFWNLAKESLIEAHKDEQGYEPTNAEIMELAKKFLKDNNYKLDENNYYPDPMLQPGVKLDLAM